MTSILMRMRLVWFGILSSMFLITFIGYNNVNNYLSDPANQARIALEAEHPVEQVSPIKNVFTIMAFIMGFISIVLPKFFLKRMLSQPRQLGTAVNIENYETRFYPARVISWAFSETSVVFGFVIAMIHHETRPLFLLASYGVVLMLIHFPKPIEIR